MQVRAPVLRWLLDIELTPRKLVVVSLELTRRLTRGAQGTFQASIYSHVSVCVQVRAPVLQWLLDIELTPRKLVVVSLGLARRLTRGAKGTFQASIYSHVSVRVQVRAPVLQWLLDLELTPRKLGVESLGRTGHLSL